MISMMLAFTLIYWGTRDLGWSRAFEIASRRSPPWGSPSPNGPGRIWLAFVEATIGLGLVALLISTRPPSTPRTTAARKARTGSAPSPARRPARRNSPEPAAPGRPREPRHLERRGRLDARPRADPHRLPDPLLLPRSDPEQSWVATMGAVLDASALVVAVSEIDMGEVFADAQRAGRPRLRPPADRPDRRRGRHPLPPPTRLLDVLARAGEPAPPISVSRDEYDAALAALSGILVVTPGRDEEAWRRFAWIRSAYDPAAGAGRGHVGRSRAVDDRPSGGGGQAALHSSASAARRLVGDGPAAATLTGG